MHAETPIIPRGPFLTAFLWGGRRRGGSGLGGQVLVEDGCRVVANLIAVPPSHRFGHGDPLAAVLRHSLSNRAWNRAEEHRGDRTKKSFKPRCVSSTRSGAAQTALLRQVILYPLLSSHDMQKTLINTAADYI